MTGDYGISKNLKRIYNMEDLCFKFILKFRLNGSQTFLGKLLFLQRVKTLVTKLPVSSMYHGMSINDMLLAVYNKSCWEKNLTQVVLNEVSEESIINTIPSDVNMQDIDDWLFQRLQIVERGCL